MELELIPLIKENSETLTMGYELVKTNIQLYEENAESKCPNRKF